MPRWAGFGFVSFAFLVTMFGTTLPTPLYPALHEERYSFGELTTTVVFAVYAFGVIAGLLLFGALSDEIVPQARPRGGPRLFGRKRFAVRLSRLARADLRGKDPVGLSAGIFTGTATAALVDLVPGPQEARQPGRDRRQPRRPRPGDTDRRGIADHGTVRPLRSYRSSSTSRRHARTASQPSQRRVTDTACTAPRARFITAYDAPKAETVVQDFATPVVLKPLASGDACCLVAISIRPRRGDRRQRLTVDARRLLSCPGRSRRLQRRHPERQACCLDARADLPIRLQDGRVERRACCFLDYRSGLRRLSHADRRE